MLGIVIVGINSDESVKRLKGENRPLNSLLDRVFALESCKFVDRVVVFEEDTPYELIKSLKPDIIVKGGDYVPEKVVGNELAEVRIFPYIQGKSSSIIIDKIDKLNK
jgi:D-beta-D-heptose 7-phosphate kinase/D-beta-D-heptose 1-phosphate adenosyltransferase